MKEFSEYSEHSQKPLLQVQGLSCHFVQRGRQRRVFRALDQVSFQLQQGEILGVVGESGSGKTTLARALAGLLNKTTGQVWLKGEPLPARYRRRDFRRYSGQLQMVFQDPYATLNPRLTIGDSLAEPLRLLGRGAEAPERIAAGLERVGLTQAVAGRYPHEFSGGQRQRIGIVRALIAEPELLICDEPVSALDVSVQAQIVNLLAELRTELGLAMLFIAHDLALVRYLCDRVLVLYHGRAVEEGPVQAVLGQPRHPYTRLLLESSPKADPRQRRDLPVQGPVQAVSTAGCAFAPRCERSQAQCWQQSPSLYPLGAGRAACYNPLPAVSGSGPS